MAKITSMAFTVCMASSILFACISGEPTGDSDEPMPKGVVIVDRSTLRTESFTTIGPISDEAIRSFGSCPAQQGIYGMQCTGRYCDNVYLFCDALPAGVTLDSDKRWRTPWFSEETSGNTIGVCRMTGIFNDDGGVTFGIVTGVACMGSYCDDMQLECTAIKTGNSDHHGRFFEYPQFSDESPAQFWPDPLVQLGCIGRYCDDLWPGTVSVSPP